MLVGEIVEPVGLVRALAGDAHRIDVRTQQSAEARFEQTVRFLQVCTVTVPIEAAKQ